MIGRTLKALAAGIAAGGAALLLTAGAAQAKPINPINPGNIGVSQCVLHPSLCTIQQPPSNGSGNGNQGSGNGNQGSGNANQGSGNQTGSSNQGSSTANQTPVNPPVVANGTPVVHPTVHQGSTSSSAEGLLVGGGALAGVSLAGLAGLVLWRRRSLA